MNTQGTPKLSQGSRDCLKMPRKGLDVLTISSDTYIVSATSSIYKPNAGFGYSTDNIM